MWPYISYSSIILLDSSTHLTDLPHCPAVVNFHRLQIQMMKKNWRYTYLGIWDPFLHNGENHIQPQPFGNCWPLKEYKVWNLSHHDPRAPLWDWPGIHPVMFWFTDRFSKLVLAPPVVSNSILSWFQLPLPVSVRRLSVQLTPVPPVIKMPTSVAVKTLAQTFSSSRTYTYAALVNF